MLLSKMAAEGGGKEMNEIKTQFTTREGLYKLLSHSEYSRPNRVPFNSQGSNPVRVSFVNVNDQSGNGDRLCFNVGRELYFYIYKGVRKVPELGRRAGEGMAGAARGLWEPRCGRGAEAAPSGPLRLRLPRGGLGAGGCPAVAGSQSVPRLTALRGSGWGGRG